MSLSTTGGLCYNHHMIIDIGYDYDGNVIITELDEEPEPPYIDLMGYEHH